MKAEHGGDIYTYPDYLDFSVNLNPLGIPPSVKRAVNLCIKNLNQYPDPNCTALISSIADTEDMYKKNILCGNGAAELIYSVVFACRPKTALLIAPSFAEYEKALHTISCKIQYYFLEERTNFVLSSSFLIELEKGYDILFLCNPNNPTGQVIEQSLLKSILDSCKKNRTILVIDECFNNFLNRPENYSMKQYIPYYENLIILKAFTKIYAIAGLRLGYLFTSNQDILNKIKNVMQPWNVSIPAQEAGIAALKEKIFLQKTRELIEKEKKYLIKQLKNLSLYVYPAAANYIFFRADFDLDTPLKKEKILIRDCSNFRNLYGYYYRIGIKKHNENKKLIFKLKEITSNL